MKKWISVLAALVLLSGCSKTPDISNDVMKLRTSLLSQGCTFDTEVTADYGDRTYTFSAHWIADAGGNLQFEMTAPETIAGITGKIDSEGGKLTFDETVLAFELQADGLLSPVSAPWVMMKALRSGFVRHWGMDGEFLRTRIDDSYRDDALTLDIWLEGNQPVRADIFADNRRILSIKVNSFALQ